MTATTTTHRIPEALENEDGEVWWVEGHVDPALMVLAVVMEQMVNVGAQEAYNLLTGGATRYTQDERRRTVNDQYADADGLFENVDHVWLRQNPDDDDRMDLVEEGTEGAEAWTRLVL